MGKLGLAWVVGLAACAALFGGEREARACGGGARIAPRQSTHLATGLSLVGGALLISRLARRRRDRRG